MSVAGMDIGSSSCKLTVFDSNGLCRRRFSQSYEITRHNRQQELTAEAIWNAVQLCIKDAASAVTDLEAICITSFGESFVLLDKDDTSLLPIMMYSDTRGFTEAKDLQQELGTDSIINDIGTNIHYMYSLPKLLWVRKNHPEIFKRISHIFLIQDYIVYKLTGKRQIDYSIAARTMLFSIQQKIWHKDLCRHTAIDPALFSTPVPSGTVAGILQTTLAKQWDINNPIYIVSGCHDQVAAAVGTAVFDNGAAVDGTGTVECITPVMDTLPDMTKLSSGGISVVPHALPDKYVCYAFSFVGGSLIKWYKENFAKQEIITATQQKTDVYALLEKNLDFKPGNLLVLPHFNGAATPYMDGTAKGAIVGLTLEHTAKDIYKALMEGVTYEMLTNIHFLQTAGIKLATLHATGGGARSAFWLQLKANILNRPIISFLEPEAGAAGSAMLAAVAMNHYSSLPKAAQVFIKPQTTFYPQTEYTATYEKIYAKYQNLYEAVKAFRLE